MLMSFAFESEFQIRKIKFQCRERNNRIDLPSKLIITFFREEFAIQNDYDNFYQRLFDRELTKSLSFDDDPIFYVFTNAKELDSVSPKKKQILNSGMKEIVSTSFRQLTMR